MGIVPQVLVLILVIGLVAGYSGLTIRVGFVVPFAFIVTYPLVVGALTILGVSVSTWWTRSSARCGSSFGWRFAGRPQPKNFPERRMTLKFLTPKKAKMQPLPGPLAWLLGPPRCISL